MRFAAEISSVERRLTDKGGFCVTLGGEVSFSVEGYFVEVCFLGEAGAVEGGVSSEGGFCVTLGGEVSFSGSSELSVVGGI